MGRRGALVLAGLLAILSVAVVVGDAAVPADREASERAAPATVSTTTAVTPPTSTTAPAPPPPTPAPTTVPPGVEVAGISATRSAEPDPPPSTSPACPAPGGADFIDAVVNDHRSIRCQQGLGDLAVDPAVTEHAQFHADRLMAAGACASLFHSSELPQWYSTSYWGENVACVAWAHGCSSDADYIMNGWMNSDEHRPNILDGHFQWIGVGVACDGVHTYVVVQFRS